jgi:hypothetical protein
MNVVPKHSHFSEIGQALGWSHGSKIVTLWAYFDESGLHSDGGKLSKLTIGGCIASFEAWEGLSASWASAIAGIGIPEFHMTDFEARVPPYKDWTNDVRQARLNVLLDIIGAAKPNCVGFTNWVRPGEDTAAIYKRCAQDVLLELGLYDDDFAIVFAHHPEFAGYDPLLQTLMKHDYGKSIRSVMIGKPIDMCPLQAADLVAFEIRCQERDDGRPQRYPLKRLSELGCTFRLSSAVD